MLTPEQIDALRDKAGHITDPITEFLLEDIARRVSEAGQLTSTAAYQVWRAQQLGMSQKEVKAKLRKLLKKSKKEVNQLLTQAAEVGYRYDLERLPTSAAIPFEKNGSIQQIVSAAVKLAQDDLTNITQTIGMVDPFGNALPLQDAYRAATDFAFKQVITGAADYNTAIRRATKNLAEKGIQWIDYESGVHTSLEAAVRRNIMGGLGLMNEQINEANHDALGCDGWEISAHANSAPDHEPFQGKQYTDKAYQSINGSLHRRIGTLNCGHVAFPIIMGVNEPQYTPQQLEKFRTDNEKGVTIEGKHYTGYEATQMQRKLERAIRKQKRRVLVDEATGDESKLLTDRIKLQVYKQQYTRFSKAAGLRTEAERLHVAGFGRKEAERAVQAIKTRHRDAARFKDSVSIIPPVKGDAITHRSLHNNLAKSEVGLETLEYIKSGNCRVEITYSDDVPKNERGSTTGFGIVINAKNTRTIKETAKALVHEVTHSKYNIGGSQYAEVICFVREHLHEHGQLTYSELRSIISTVKELYPEHSWRKGGRNKWRE